jgi:hypothetical protein
MSTYYTMQVKLSEGYTVAGNNTIEFKDIEGTEMNIRACQDAWTRGVKLQTAPGTYQLVSPFLISEIFLIKQDKKYSI